MGRQRKFTPWLAGITALVALAILLFPVYAVIVGSFETNAQLLGSHYNFFPPTPTLANYRNVISTQGSHILSQPDHRRRHRAPHPGHRAARRARAGQVPLPGDRGGRRIAAGRADPAVNCDR